MPIDKRFTPTEIHSICAGMEGHNFYGEITLRFREGTCRLVELSQIIKPESMIVTVMPNKERNPE